MEIYYEWVYRINFRLFFKDEFDSISITTDAIVDKELYIASAFLDKENPLTLYKKRWSIDICFKAFKTQGFCLDCIIKTV